MAQLTREHLGLLPPGLPPQVTWEALATHWTAQPVAGCQITDLDAALVRLGRDFCRKVDKPCPLGRWCGRRRAPVK